MTRDAAILRIHDVRPGLLVIPAFDATGRLPRGRWVTDVNEVHQAFVDAPQFAGSSTRSEVWRKFQTALTAVRKRRTPIPAAFMSGSFISNVLDPGDIDAAVIVDVSEANPITLGVLTRLFDGFRDPFKLDLDLFMIQWSPDGSQDGQSPPYHWQRGKWDDFWQRYVPKPERPKQVRAHAMPVRGYLEVVIDGYR